MSQPAFPTERDDTTLPVSSEFRDKLRVAKAEQGVSYEEYLLDHVPFDLET